jgi:hypothetical protein|nr:MAG TPA: hypothetical protein [Caudoviricetes sp.]
MPAWLITGFERLGAISKMAEFKIVDKEIVNDYSGKYGFNAHRFCY